MSEIQPTLVLTPQQIAFFNDNGFLALESITTPHEVAMMRQAYDRIFSARAGRDTGDQFDLAGTDEEGKEAALPQILNPSKYAPELADTLYRANALAIARQLLGEAALPMGDHAIFKPARHGAATPWHQDEAYWGENMDYNSVSTWLPLQEATLENGCMQFIPGSNKGEILPHHNINNDPRIHGLEVELDLVDTAKAVACPLPPGGCTFHSCRTLHYTGPNRSEIPRRAYTYVFGVPPTPRQAPRDFYWTRDKQTARAERAKAAGATGKAPGV